MTTAPHSDRTAPKRRLRNAVAAVLLGTTVLAGTAAVAVPPPATAAAAPAETRAMPDSLAPLAERVSPAVVTISVTQGGPVRADAAPQRRLPFPPGSPFEEFFRRFGLPDGAPGGQDAPDQEPRGGGMSVGSGFIIDGAGYVVTNNHVVDGGKAITVTLNDGTELPATLVGRDAKTDLALLKVSSDKELPHLDFGDSDKARVGDWVVAIGNPFGLGGTVTTGVVSARGRNIGAGPYDDFIQTDAAINRGNSGGPMFNLNGEVIGINTAIFSPSGGSVGIGFAIPSNLARQVVAELKERGHVERGWLGVRIQPLTPELAEGLGLPKPQGALVAEVTAGSPAAKAGLKQGDVVVRFDGKPVDGVRDLTRLVAGTAAGSDARIDVVRGGKETTLTTRIEKLAEEPQMASAGPDADQPSHPALSGLKLAALDAETRAQLGLDRGARGVVVVGVSPKAGAVPVQPGDLIEAVGGEPVASPAELARKVTEAGKAGKKAVLLLVNRQGNESFVALKLAMS
ncbi:DegQ family serine endoprotease [Azospirillum sp.]|uniref:DegQ family serine endoprotease n=1 Tax=Azospirillum sp. TaxID=34012 RepID=UPI002D712236|nr:DegQ family serine endoprotease [Azospirillum sp.]HYD68601.1 DegQ family serine endoprotease [Azospirillum sp.]